MEGKEKRYEHIYKDTDTGVKPVNAAVETTTESATDDNSVMSLIMGTPPPKPVFVPKNKPEPAKANESIKPAEKAPTEPAPASTPSPEPKTTKDLRKTAENSAKVWASTLSLVTGQLCSAISGQPAKNYKPSKEDQDEYIQVCASYFEEAGDVMSPKTLFIIASLSFFGATIAKSVGDRRKNASQEKAAAQYKAAKAKEKKALKVVEETGDTKQLEAARSEIKKTINEPKRNIFQIDSKGYYTHDVYGNYAKGHKGDNPEKCTSPEILAIIKEHRNSGDPSRKKWGYINGEVRKHLYGSREPVKNE